MAVGVRLLPSDGSTTAINSYPHTWPWVLNFGKPDTPWKDVRVRKALNYCTNREGLVTLLNGLADPAAGIYNKNNPLFRQAKSSNTPMTRTRRKRY